MKSCSAIWRDILPAYGQDGAEDVFRAGAAKAAGDGDAIGCAQAAVGAQADVAHAHRRRRVRSSPAASHAGAEPMRNKATLIAIPITIAIAYLILQMLFVEDHARKLFFVSEIATVKLLGAAGCFIAASRY